ncbi:hypothetical protein ASG31_10045 [Chryseobacterium sp. Leaf404]|nr:hypothetical protein ASG31_10045 [Chryseobacterium sp. Leaf404]
MVDLNFNPILKEILRQAQCDNADNNIGFKRFKLSCQNLHLYIRFWLRPIWLFFLLNGLKPIPIDNFFN